MCMTYLWYALIMYGRFIYGLTVIQTVLIYTYYMYIYLCIYLSTRIYTHDMEGFTVHVI